MAAVSPACITSSMIAPCGMDCALCIGHVREKDRCAGCANDKPGKPGLCRSCAIKRCAASLPGARKYCFKCKKFPCRRLKQLDKRYRTKYGMSMLANLAKIRDGGIRSFIKQERKRWACPECGGVLCVHRGSCLYCGAKRRDFKWVLAKAAS